MVSAAAARSSAASCGLSTTTIRCGRAGVTSSNTGAIDPMAATVRWADGKASRTAATEEAPSRRHPANSAGE